MGGPPTVRVIITGVNRIIYVGHATLLLELDGLRLLTDPLLTSRVSHLARQTAVPDFEVPHFDAVLLSHLHADHLHLRSLRCLSREQLIVAPRGAAAFLGRHGFSHVIEVAAGEMLSIKGITIEATPADHPARPLPGRPHTDSLGYVIHGRRRVYFSGDTDLFAGMAGIGQVDVALLPVWGWGPTLGAGHMDPYRAAQALELLRPSLAIPIHWGTYFPLGLRPLLPNLVRQPPYTFARHANRLAPDVQVCVLDPGDALDLAGFFRQMGDRG